MNTEVKAEPRNILRHLRSERGITQAQLAEATKIPQPDISRFEAYDGANMGYRRLKRLAMYFGIDILVLTGENHLSKK